MSGELERSGHVALHEAGHLVIAAMLGRAPLAASVRGGPAADGCALSAEPAPLPAGVLGGHDAEAEQAFILWPAALRDRIEADVLILLAGNIAEMLTGPVAGRVADPVAEQAAALAVDVETAETAVLAWAADVTGDPAHESDRDRIARVIRAWFGGMTPPAGAWLRHMDAQARQLVTAHAEVIKRVAAALSVHEVLDGEALEQIIAGVPA